MLLDIAEMLPLTVVECPGCGNAITVLQRFGQFRLESLLGTGGMGAVYKAFDVALQRHLALKILQRNWSHDALLTAQFEKEAALTARVNHPNVVRVYSTGKAHGMFYIAMELVDRGSLDSLMDQKGRLPEVEVLRVGIQVAEGLEAANRAGLIHRDIKPGNILFGENSRAKIVDFGLALQSNQAESALGEIWGTPFYVSPETLAAQPEDLRSDMYALGSSLWHALTGAPPYPSTSTSVHELLHLKKRPVDLALSLPGLHPRTTAALNRAIAPEPAERFSDYATLAVELKAALAELETPKQTNPAGTRPQPAPRRALALLFLTCTAVAGAWWVKQRSAPPADSVPANAEQALLSDDERLAKACALLSQPAQLDLALRRLELISRSPELRPEQQVWAAVALGTGYALRGEPARQASALGGLPEDLTPLWKHFAIRLRAASALSQAAGTNSGPALPDEEQSVVLLWQALGRFSQESPENALPLLQKVSALRISDRLPYVKQLLSVAPVLTKDLGAIAAMERDFLAPGKTAGISVRTNQAELLQSGLHPVLARSKRVSALLQSAKTEQAQSPRQAPATVPTPPTAPSLKSSPPAPPPKAPATISATTAAVEELRIKVPLQILAFQFKSARENLASFPPGNKQQEVQRAALSRQADEVESLFRWCLLQINQGGTLPSPIMRNGSPFKSDPVRADERNLFVKTDAATPPLPIAWQEISPLFLVKILQFRSAVLQNTAQRSELLWAAGTVHLLSGSKKNAADFSEEAAKINPAYRAALQTLFAPESTP
jgi:serine/threonine protein kinase